MVYQNKTSENLNFAENTRGGLFAGATAGNGIGASASLAGQTNNGAGAFGVSQAEAHVPGKSSEVIRTVSTNVGTNVVDVATMNVQPHVESNVETKVDVEAPVVVETSEPVTPSQEISVPPITPIEQSTTPVVAQTEQPEQLEQTEQTEQPEQTSQYTKIQTTSTLASPETTTVNNPS